MACDFSSMFHMHVVSDVVNKFRDNYDKALFDGLQASWEMRMIQCGAILPNYTESRPAPTPLETPIQTPLPDMEPAGMYNIATGPSDYDPNSPWTDMRNGVDDVKYGTPNTYMATASPWMNTTPLGVDINVAYVEGMDDEKLNREGSNQPSTDQDFFTLSKRKRDEYSAHLNSISNNNYIMPQQDESDYCTIEFEVGEDQIFKSKRGCNSSVIPQCDGINDKSDPSDDETHLNDDDDDDDDDADDENDDVNCEDIVLAQFEKVTRTKNIWKCNLKNGIMHLNGKEIFFNKAMGNFDF